MNYIKYDLDFFDAITFPEYDTDDEAVDKVFNDYCQSAVKGFLMENNSFLPEDATNTEIGDYIDRIEAQHTNLLNTCQAQFYKSYDLILNGKKTTTDNEVNSTYGDEDVTGKYYEPLEQNQTVQTVVNTNGSHTEWGADKVETDGTVTESVVDLSQLKMAFDTIDEKVENLFSKFINFYA